jgi:Flp pilus assembly protein TadG
VRFVRLRKSHIKKSNSGAGSQLLEFALVLPFLLVMVVGIIDFGQAYNLKQKLNDAAREGARFAVQLSCSDCTQTAPATTQTLENSIVSYLTTAGVDTCGLTGTTAPTIGPQPYASWTFTSPQQCTGTTGNFTIEIDRGATFVNSGGAIVPSTQIVLNSPYAWTFNRIVGLLPGTGTFQAISSISSSAVMQN